VTITLTWKHALVAIALLAVLSVSVWLMVRSAQQQSVLDAERVQRIAELEDELESALHGADEAKDEADEIRDELQKVLDQIAQGNKAIEHDKKVKVMPPQERVVILNGQNELLQAALDLSMEESQALRRSLTLMGMALANSRERYELLDKRYSSLKRSKKKEKRRKILTAVGTSVGSFGVGVGIGKIR
jgi:predicted ribosome quality control (RQC) complex YloA/Tae2 family protein